MPTWQVALALLVVVWMAQAIGTYVQMRHYSAVMGEISKNWSDGFIGAGNCRARLGAGVVLLLVVGPDSVVRRVMIMKGRTVFARFARVVGAEGRPVAALPEVPALRESASGKALAVAMQQIEKAASRATPASATA